MRVPAAGAAGQDFREAPPVDEHDGFIGLVTAQLQVRTAGEQAIGTRVLLRRTWFGLRGHGTGRELLRRGEPPLPVRLVGEIRREAVDAEVQVGDFQPTVDLLDDRDRGGRAGFKEQLRTATVTRCGGCPACFSARSICDATVPRSSPTTLAVSVTMRCML